MRSNGYWYCYCEEEKNGEKVKKCQLCVISVIFREFETDIDNNIFDVDFLNCYYSKFECLPFR